MLGRLIPSNEHLHSQHKGQGKEYPKHQTDYRIPQHGLILPQFFPQGLLYVLVYTPHAHSPGIEGLVEEG